MIKILPGARRKRCGPPATNSLFSMASRRDGKFFWAPAIRARSSNLKAARRLFDRRQNCFIPGNQPDRRAAMAKFWSARPTPEKFLCSAPDRKPKAVLNPTRSTPRFFRTGDAYLVGRRTRANHGKVSFFVRSGNTSKPQKNWSAWSGPYKMRKRRIRGLPASALPAVEGCVPGSREAVMLREVSWVSVAYQPENVAPVLDDIAIQDAGVRVQGFSAAPVGPAPAASAQLKMPQRPALLRIRSSA